MHCTGVPKNAPVLLEDEFISVDHNDSLDSSFQYYIAQAKDAASEADALGEEVVRQGLEMDLRSEAAVEELEELCGGAINVDRLGQIPCVDNPATTSVNEATRCNLVDRLTQSAPTGYAGDVEGARQCLGLAESNPVKWAAVGDQPLCIWTHTSKTFPACVCPKDGTKCPPGPCPAIKDKALSCEDQFKVFDKTTTPSTRVYAVDAEAVTQTLGLSVTAMDFDPPVNDLAKWLVNRGVNPSQNGKASTEQVWANFATKSKLAPIAASLGIKMDYDGSFVITLNNGRWLDTRLLVQDFQARWGGTAAGWNKAWKESPWPCGPLTPDIEELCKAVPMNAWPAACGGCWDEQHLTLTLLEGLSALRGLTESANTDNVFTLHGPSVVSADSWVMEDASYAGIGISPRGEKRAFWETASGRRCFEASALNSSTANGKFDCYSIVQGPPVTLASTDHTWTYNNCEESFGGAFLPGARAIGCGGVPRFLFGTDDDGFQVGVQMKVGSASPWCAYPPPSKHQFVCGGFTCVAVPSWPKSPVCFDFPDERDNYLADHPGAVSVARPKNAKGVDSFIAWQVRGPAILTALTLGAAVDIMGAGGCDTRWSELPAMDSLLSFQEARRKLECSADTVEGNLSRMYLAQLPQDVIRTLAVRVPTSTWPTHRGQYGESVAQIAAQVQELVRGADSIVQALRDMGNIYNVGATSMSSLDIQNDVDSLEIYVSSLRQGNVALDQKLLDKNQELSNLRTRQAIGNLALSCAVAIGNAVPSVTTSGGFPSGGTVGVSMSPGAAMNAAATCGHSVVSRSIEHAMQDINKDITGLQGDKLANDKFILETIDEQTRLGMRVTENDKTLVLLDMQRQVVAKADAVNDAATSLNQTYANLHSQMSRLDGIRNKARRALSKALMLSNDDVGRVFEVNRAMRSRMNLARVRYERALARAKRAAFMARRAVEQKIGMDLSKMTKLVGSERPTDWADKLCDVTGVDYEKLGSEPGLDCGGADCAKVFATYVDQMYISDWVSRLEDFVEGYRNEYPFTDADDIMVVSLKDELLSVRESCETEGPNALLQTDSSKGDAWAAGCAGDLCLTADAESPKAHVRGAGGFPFQCRTSDPSKVTARADGLATPVLPTINEPQQCRAGGGASTVELRYTPRGRIQPAQIPDLMNWTRADACTTTGCTDLSGKDTPLVGTTTIGANAIGTAPAVGGTLSVSGAGAPSVTTELALAMVVTRSDTAVSNLWYRDTVRSATVKDRIQLFISGSVLSFQQCANYGVATCSAALTAAIPATGPFMVAVRGSAVGLEIYINGVRLAQSSTALLSTRIPGNVLTSAGTRVAEVVTYNRRISDAELAGLHQYLGAQYDVGLMPRLVTGNVAGAGLRYTQVADVDAGDYYLSWHEPTTCAEASSLRVETSLGGSPLAAFAPTGCVNSLATAGSNRNSDRWLAPNWSRRFGVVSASRASALTVSFAPAAQPTANTTIAATPRALLAAVQLEVLYDAISNRPNEFFPTDQDTLRLADNCEDTDGDTFRGAYWKYGCEYFCPSDSSTECQDFAKRDKLPTQCYWQANFHISQDDVEAGKLIQNGGFAKGNFNYRHNTIGVNVVGNQVKNCELSSLPSTCYANNFLQYTLHQDPPYRIRNWDGKAYHASLHPGRIQQGKALVAERYLTNPLSSADRNLMQDYTQEQFRGRPLEGNYTLRIYDTDALDWSKLEDVQLVMNYRFWTRNEAQAD